MYRDARPAAPDTVPMTGVKSEAIGFYGYDEPSRTLFLAYRSGQTYRYADVPPSLVAEFLDAKSKGGFVAKRVRGRFDLLGNKK